MSAMDLREWSREAMDRIAAELRVDPHWGPLLAARSSRGVHLAIFVEPFLGHVVEGRKVIESRFAIRRYPPYGRVARGDIVLVKAASGPVKGVCEAGTTRFEELAPGKLDALREELAEAMCAKDDAFWDACRGARYATLVELLAFRPVSPLVCPKRDRRGWVVLQEPETLRPRRAERRRPSGPPPTW